MELDRAIEEKVWVQQAQHVIDDGWDMRLRIEELGDALSVMIAHSNIERSEVVEGMLWLKALILDASKNSQDSIEVTAAKIAYGAGTYALGKTKCEFKRFIVKQHTPNQEYKVE